MKHSESIGKLIKALAAVSRAVGSLEPDKRNKEQNYDYISADKILQRIGGAMAEAGVVIVPGISSNRYEAITYTSKYGEKTRIDAVAEFLMTVGHDSGEYMQMAWAGYGTDYVTPDKALYKAITSGHKYFLMKLFNVGVGNEDGEHEAGEEMGEIVQPKPRPAAQQRPLATNGRAANDDNGHKHGIGTAVLVKGKDDEKPGEITGHAFSAKGEPLYEIEVGGKTLTLSATKFTVIAEQAALLEGDVPNGY